MDFDAGLTTQDRTLTTRLPYTPASPPTILHALRVSAVAGFMGALCWITAAVLFPTISDALDPTALDHGLAALASHSTLALACQHLFALSDIAIIVFIFGLASIEREFSLTWLGAFLLGINFALDMLVAASVIAVTKFIALHAAADPAMHAAGIATLGFGAVLDFREGFFATAGWILLGGAAWHGRHWPRWLVALALLNGILWFPFLPFSFILGGGVFAIWVLGMSVTLWQREVRA